MKIKSIAHHRNGVGGVPFHIAIVEDGGRDYVVIRFPKGEDQRAGGVLCAAFDCELIGQKEIRFGKNSFRGDRFAECVDEIIEIEEGGLV